MREEIKRNMLIINSRDRKNPATTDSGDFVYPLGENSLDIEAISLKSASIPHTYYNVNETNNTLKYSKGSEFVLTVRYEGNLLINALETPYVITEGVYTQNEFLDTLNKALDGVLEIGYDAVAGKYYYVTINNFDAPFIMDDYQYDPTNANLWTALGFVVPLTLSNTPNPTPQLATNLPSAPFNVSPVEFFEVDIPVAQYDITTLLPEITTALSTNISGSIVAIVNTSPPVGKVYISGATDTWKFGTCDLAHFLGFQPEAMLYALNQTAQHKPDLLGNRYLYIASNTLANGYNCLQKAGSKTSILGSVPVCSTYGSKDTWEAKYPIIKQYDGSVNISEVDIKILDENNNPVNLDGADVILIFEVWATVRL
jgi:hypothetical protein